MPAIPIPKHWARLGGLDFGIDHPAAAVCLAHDRDADVVYITHCFRQRGTTPLAHVEAVEPWGSWIPYAWPHDGLQRDKGSGMELLKPTALDLFCGAAGGWSLGLHRAGVRTVAACEINDWRRETFSRNFPDVRMYADVRELTADRLLGDLGYLPDWIVGSPPCQDASLANTKGRGVDGPRTGLFFEAIRLIGECRPRWAILENVPGLRTRGADRVLGELEALGYACWPTVVGAWHAGAPHRRNRVWIIAANLDAPRQPPGQPGQPRPAGLGAAADADSCGLRLEPGRRGGTDGASAAFAAFDAGDADDTRLAFGEGVGGDAFPQLQAIERAIGTHGLAWNGGPARHLGMADGIFARLARIRVPTGRTLKSGNLETISAERACVSAYGDAVVPKLTEAIARSILRSDGGHTGPYP